MADSTEKLVAGLETIQDLCRCPDCQGGRVYDIDRYQAGEGHWSVSLRCPDCESGRLGWFSQTEMDKLDIGLFEGAVELELITHDVVQENMREYGNKFIVALRAGHILPEDF